MSNKTDPKTPAAPAAKKNKATERTLRHTFDVPEKIELGGKLASILSEMAQIDADLDRIKSEFKGKTAAAEAQLNSVRDKINSGYELRLTKCEVVLDKPKAGMAQVIRLDTGDVVEEREMTEQEKQAELDIELNPTEGGKVLEKDGKITGGKAAGGK